MGQKLPVRDLEPYDVEDDIPIRRFGRANVRGDAMTAGFRILAGLVSLVATLPWVAFAYRAGDSVVRELIGPAPCVPCVGLALLSFVVSASFIVLFSFGIAGMRTPPYRPRVTVACFVAGCLTLSLLLWMVR